MTLRAFLKKIISTVCIISLADLAVADERQSKLLDRNDILLKLGAELRSNAPDLVRMLPEISKYEARNVEPGTYSFVSGRRSAQFVARRLQKLQSDFATKKQKASVFQAGNTILLTSTGAAFGPLGATIGYEASEFINAFVDAGLDKTYRQIIVDSEAIVNVAFREASDERLDSARNLIRRAQIAEDSGNSRSALLLRKQAVRETLESGAFSQRLASNETCVQIGEEACQTATRRIIETNSIRIDLNAGQIDQLIDKANRNSEKIAKITKVFAEFKTQTNERLNGLTLQQEQFSNELKIVSGHLNALNNVVDFQGQQIGFIQHSLWQKMTPPEKEAALNTGGFFPSMDLGEREKLAESLKQQSAAFKSVAVWGERVQFMNAASQLVSAISAIDSDIISEDVAIAVSKATFVADIAHRTYSLVTNFGSLSAFGAWGAGISIAASALKLFGKPKPDPDQKRFEAIMKALGVLNTKIDNMLKLQRQTLQAIAEIDLKLVELDRRLNARFDRIEEKIDYLTDLVSSSIILPRSDACLRVIRQASDNFRFDPKTGYYRSYEDRTDHWKSRGRDMDTCFDYISQVSTLYRTQEALVDAVFLVSERKNDLETASLKSKHSFLTDRVREIFRYNEQTPHCLRHHILVGARAPTSFTGMRPYFSYIENLSKLTCASLPVQAEPDTLLSAFETRNPAEAKWPLIEQQIDQNLLMTFSDLALYVASMKRLLVRPKGEGGELSLLSFKDLLDPDVGKNFTFAGRKDANDDLRKLTDLLDIAIAQESLKSGTLFLPFIESAMVEFEFGHSDKLPQDWHDLVARVAKFTADKEVVSLRERRNLLSEQRAALLPDVFQQESLNRRSLYLDNEIEKLALLNASIEGIDNDLTELKASSGLLEAESKVLEELKCGRVPSELMTDQAKELSELSEAVLNYCFKKVGQFHPSKWQPLHRYLIATQLLQRYPEMAENFWTYVTVRNLTEGSYSNRRNCLSGSADPQCHYRFDGPGGNRIGTTDLVINVARQSKTDSLLRLLLPDFRFANANSVPNTKDENQNGKDALLPSWAYTWIGSSGEAKLSRLPLTRELLGNSAAPIAQTSAPIRHTPALQILVQKRQQVERELVHDDWVNTALKSEEFNKPQLAEAVYSFSLLQN